jgi:hypothetical protein
LTQPVRELWATIVDAMNAWHQGKLFLEYSLSVDHDALHVIVGLLVWLVAALLLRRPITSWLSFLWCLAITLWNETVDLWIEQWPDPGRQYGEGAKDVLLTMTVPVLLMAAARLRPDLFRTAARRRRRRR